MIKKEYQKPTMNVVRLKTQHHLLIVSANSEGLGGSDKLNYDGDDADMDEYAW